MREGASPSRLQHYKNTRLAGLGPAIASLQGHFNGPDVSTVWNLPLSEPCDELIGSYSINNFPGARSVTGRGGSSFCPVVVEFKLSTVEQRVKKRARVTTGLWDDDDSFSNGSNHSSKYGPPRPDSDYYGMNERYTSIGGGSIGSK